MPVLKPHQLVSPFSSWAALSRDQGDHPGAEDGLLTLAEMKLHLKQLSTDRDERVAEALPTHYVDMQIDSARKLYQSMIDSSADAVQYLPDELMGLPINIRRRASELLTRDDVTTMGVIDQFVIDHARGRYQALAAYAPAALSSRKTALFEIKAIAAALGLD